MTELFSIPFYSCSPNKLKRRYDKYILSQCKNVIDTCKDVGIDASKYIENERTRNSKQSVWRYNQIVGYIRIIYVEYSIYFYIYEPDEKRIVTFSSKKHFVSGHMMNNYSFSLINEKDILIKLNENLKKVIDLLPKKYYVDLEQYNNVSKLLNFNKLLEIDSKWL